ncbi:hypothetical protein GCM10010885_08330 [Alicyclobacillus cellulosilyticus]|uniref:Cytochrome c oxidase subunit 2 n=1 Tax=Alicyclobacillus cellulosilyticus TaxID=1003997 RepID=A0A917K7Y3_9BACL|nr:cytochrome c oxidase subunit II [Alicyclobacillus cellulosilyticus]GGJ01446.1 hypothetical protein GCM10010885_08330 [Alicyclobacillus cellulosilyticus]
MHWWLPVELTQMAHKVDTLFYVMLFVVTFFFLLVEVLLITFLIRYRRTRTNQVGAPVHGNNVLETIWTLVPTLILVFLGVYSVRYVYALQTPVATPNVIHVIGHEWYWEFRYPNGVVTQNDLRVPAGQPVLFDITSGDVVHGFYIPAVRIQQDAVPGRLTQFWVTADAKDVGRRFEVPCDQFCGAGHPKMIAWMTVMSPADYQAWLNQQKEKSPGASSGS